MGLFAVSRALLSYYQQGYQIYRSSLGEDHPHLIRIIQADRRVLSKLRRAGGSNKGV